MDGPIRDTGIFIPTLYLPTPFFPRKVVNVIMIHSKQPYFLASVEVMGNSGDNYLAVLKAEKEKLERRGVAVIGVVGDNASGVQHALRRFVSFSARLPLCCLLIQTGMGRSSLRSTPLRSTHLPIANG